MIRKSNLALIMLVTLASASPVSARDVRSMTCAATGFEGKGKDYVVRFDKDRRELTLTRGDVTPYEVQAVKEASNSLIVSGLTVKGGPTFRAHFSPDKMMEYFLPGMDVQKDHCR
jgi:hypothetical protein